MYVLCIHVVMTACSKICPFNHLCFLISSTDFLFFILHVVIFLYYYEIILVNNIEFDEMRFMRHKIQFFVFFFSPKVLILILSSCVELNVPTTNREISASYYTSRRAVGGVCLVAHTVPVTNLTKASLIRSNLELDSMNASQP